ncbi:efflux RND transporter periplasmic adaptor subunit [Rhizobium leguminosarum bv. viciae]|uniref:efflux RND transporter periplasmic adaptor subunit n=1 Tax=Rhizobium leguminosarum TaxID=384 RepID=UPI0014425204|nr:efflux RND transporter periplasmic adaptor subunit [Rhizobium leguminosarum]NKJ94721.1 efflux RND transporter periplasmic adaptor subunit [Rhizobium leguminosarum bv. viciae]NKK87465.1 efflux RND transporter periplasmic adaptor subunit [Rhizobium leguminosarum bv. viciae]
MNRWKPNAVATLSLVCLTACAPSEEERPKDARHVDIVVVQPAEVRDPISTSGEIKARTQSDLSFRSSGRITQRMVDVGDHVKAGEVLARIDAEEQKADLQVSLANLHSAQALAIQAGQAFDRQQSLFATGVTTQAAVDDAQAALLTARASVQSAQAQVDTSQDALKQTDLEADADGIITARNAEVGEVAQPAQAVFTLAYDGPRDAVINVDESVLLGREFEDVADVTLLSGRGTFKARVREVSPAIDTTTGTIRVKLNLEGGIAAPLGSSVVVTGRYKPKTVIELPWSAMASSNGSPAVWVVEPKTHAVALQPVTIDNYASGRFTVASGLQMNDIVVSGGTKFLSDGDVIHYEGAGL